MNYFDAFIFVLAMAITLDFGIFAIKSAPKSTVLFRHYGWLPWGMACWVYIIGKYVPNLMELNT